MSSKSGVGVENEVRVVYLLKSSNYCYISLRTFIRPCYNYDKNDRNIRTISRVHCKMVNDYHTFKICKNSLKRLTDLFYTVIIRRAESQLELEVYPSTNLHDKALVYLNSLDANTFSFNISKPKEQVYDKFSFLQDSPHHTYLHAD